MHIIYRAVCILNGQSKSNCPFIWVLSDNSFQHALFRTCKIYFFLYFAIIGGHGFLDGVGVHTPGVGQKICRPPSAAKIFSRRPFHQGVILLNRNEKKCSPQGSICPISFSPWGYQGGGVYLFHLGCRPQKVFYPGVHPPTPPPRAHL